MYLTRPVSYAFKLSFSQSQGTSVYRRAIGDRNATTSAFLLATVGLSLSMISVKQMLASPAGKRRLQRLQ